MKRIIKRVFSDYLDSRQTQHKKKRLKKYISNDRVPWSVGYEDYKWLKIQEALANFDLIQCFSEKRLPEGYGIGVDERIVEYPWILANLSGKSKLVLDAGSTFNYEIILDSPIVTGKELTIYTYYPEGLNHNDRRISYVYGDLRELPFKDQLFEEIVCQSTLEHVDMDNSMYGYQLESNTNDQQKSYEYLKVVSELVRVLKQDGILLITFPYGRFMNYGFFQHIDLEMVARIQVLLDSYGQSELSYLRYTLGGWIFSSEADCRDLDSYNPHTGYGKGTDGAAHSRAICCLKFIKNSK